MKRDYRTRSIVLVASLSLFRIIIGSLTGLGDAESYYWTWSQHLSLSYYDHPPMVAYVIAFFTGIGGNNVFFVRLGSVLIFSGTMAMIHIVAEKIFKSSRVGFLSLLIFNLTPVFAIGAMQIVPDIPCAFFWMLSVYLLWEITERDKPWLWYPLGVTIGLGLLSKYFLILMVPSLFFLMLHSENRRWFKRKEPYLAMLLAVLIFSPVLIWNYQNDFPSFRYHLVGRHKNPPFSVLNALRFIGGQFAYMSPLLLGGYLYAVYKSFKLGFSGDKRYLFLFWTSAPTLIFFYVISLWTKQAEPHWPGLGYFTAIIASAGLIHEVVPTFDERKKRIFKRYTNSSIGLSIFAMLFFYVQIFFPLWRPKVPQWDITNEIWGWDKVGVRVEEIYKKLSPEGKPFVFSMHYLLSSQLAFATQGEIPVYKINNRLDQFNFWMDEKEILGKNGIYIGDNRFEDDPAELYKCDKLIKDEPDLLIHRGGSSEWSRKFTFYKCYGYQGPK